MKLNFSLRRKKKDDAAVEESPTPEEKSSKSADTKSAGGGAKQWLFHHVEKVVCAVTLLLLGWLVYGAIGKLELSQNQAPKDLTARVQQIKDKALASTWPEDRYPVPDFPSMANRGSATIPMDRFAFGPLTGKAMIAIGKRSDPALYPVRNVHARAGSGLFYVTSQRPGLSGMAVEGGAQQQKPLPPAFKLQGAKPPVEGEVLTEGRRWIVVHALIPYGEQLAEYQRAFANALGYQRKRDVPQYIDARIKRLEIKPGMDERQLNWASAQEWSFREWIAATQNEQRAWARVDVDELVDSRYIERTTQTSNPMSLTKPLGPLAFQSWKPWATHPDIPLAPPRTERPGPKAGFNRFDERPAPAEKTQPAKAPQPKRPAGGAGDIFGPDPDEESPEPEPTEEDAPEEGPAEEEVDDGAAGSVQYKLLRIFDFTVEPGKSYRYKVQLAVLNPNRAELGIPARFLENPETRDQYYRVDESQWSESSPTVHIPTDAQLFASSIRTVTEETTHRVADVVVRILDIANGRISNAKIPLRLGGMVRGTTRSLEIDPANRQAVSYDGATVTTDYTLIDMRGGGSGPAEHSSGELLFMDAQGNLIARDAAGDQSAVEEFKKLEDVFTAAAEPAGKAGNPDKPADEKEKEGALFKASGKKKKGRE